MIINMKTYIVWGLIFTAFLIQVSCIDRLDFIAETEEGQLVIYGLVTDQQDAHAVSVSRTSAFGMPPQNISGAKVSLILEGGARIGYTEVDQGKYELTGFKPIEKNKYALEVVVENQTYLSSYEMVPSLIAEDRLSFSFTFEPFRTNVEERVFTVFAETQLPETTDPIFLRWTVEETYYWEQTLPPCIGLCPPPPDPCFISAIIEPSRMTLFDGSSTTTRKTNQVMAKRVADNSFLFPFFASVRQFSLNRNAYEYWEKIKVVTNNQGSLFDAPPAPIRGNIRNVNHPEELILGYFEVAKETVTRIYTSRNDYPFYLVPPCTYILGRPINEYPAECRSCERRAQGKRWTNAPPAWWRFD